MGDRPPASGEGAPSADDPPPSPLLLGALDASEDGLLVLDLEGTPRHWNRRLLEMLDLPPEAFGDASWQELAGRAGDRFRRPARFRQAVDRSLKRPAEESRLELRLRDGGVVRLLWRPVRADGEVVGGVAVLRDVTDLEEARRERSWAERWYRTFFEMSPSALVVSRPGGEIIAVNRRFERLLGYPVRRVRGRQVQELEIWVDLQDRADILRRLDERGAVRDYETQLRTRTGEFSEVELSVDRLELEGETHVVWAVRDVTDRNEYRRELEQKALYDDLTGLPNRTLLFDRMDHAVKRADRESEPLSVLFIDLDDFKAVNSSYGHSVGDRVLAETATRLRSVLREADTLGRLGGDEFLAVLQRTDEEEAKNAALRLIQAVTDRPFEVPDGSVRLGVSVGIAPLSPERRAPGELLRAADAAMRRAKSAAPGGKARFRVYAPEDETEITRLQRKERLRKALEDDEFVLYYQPVVDLREERITGAEALIRWEHPEQGLFGPGDFIPLAERSGLIEEIDHWSLRRAARDAAGWRDAASGEAGAGAFHVASNVAAPFYQSPDFAERVWSALEDSGLPPSSLQLEITERLLVTETGGWSRLRGAGVRLAVDDFGTGYSSLQYLRQLDADVLKIDRYFIRDLTQASGRTSVIVRSVLTIGRQLGMEVIAEGVETGEERDHLADLGCRYAQGYFFARPMPAADFRDLLAGRAAPFRDE